MLWRKRLREIAALAVVGGIALSLAVSAVEIAMMLATGWPGGGTVLSIVCWHTWSGITRGIVGAAFTLIFPLALVRKNLRGTLPVIYAIAAVGAMLAATEMSSRRAFLTGLGIIAVGAVIARLALRDTYPVPPNRCSGCGHELGRGGSGRCPECGAATGIPGGSLDAGIFAPVRMIADTPERIVVSAWIAFGALLVLLLISTYAGLPNCDAASFGRIETGMSAAEVWSIIGPPDSSEGIIIDLQTKWIYSEFSLMGIPDERVVDFRNGRVASVNVW
jgi:hypothetical protein